MYFSGTVNIKLLLRGQNEWRGWFSSVVARQVKHCRPKIFLFIWINILNAGLWHGNVHSFTAVMLLSCRGWCVLQRCLSCLQGDILTNKLLNTNWRYNIKNTSWMFKKINGTRKQCFLNLTTDSHIYRESVFYCFCFFVQPLEHRVSAGPRGVYQS